MREILFRGKRLDNGEWVYGYLIKHPSAVGFTNDSPWYIEVPPKGPNDNSHIYNVDPGTVGQYTGLTDKNGVKIFEGNIVKDSKGKVGYAQFLIQEAGYVIVWKTCDTRMGHRNRGSRYDSDTSLEVICNIHDNPELLEGDDGK